jgi:hypothetical protein
MTTQPYHTHAEYFAASGVYRQLIHKENIMGLSDHEQKEKELMEERLSLHIPNQNENRNTPTQDMEHDKRQVDGITR